MKSDLCISLSDLFCENFGLAEPSGGDANKMRNINDFAIFEGRTGRNEGNEGIYSTVDCSRLLEDTEKMKKCGGVLAELIKEHALRGCISCPGKILVAALGNPRITVDSLGARAADKITATGYDNELSEVGYPETYVIKTGVRAKSGIDSSDLIAIISGYVSADLVIAIDALAAKSPERIASVIQITDAGISPGSGVSAHRIPINKKITGCPVITIGVPTVIRASGILPLGINDTDYLDKKQGYEVREREQPTAQIQKKGPGLYTSAMIDSAVDIYSAVIASGINIFFSECRSNLWE